MEVGDLGFIDPKTNTVRSEKELRQLENKPKPSSAASQSDSVETSVRNGFSNVASRTTGQINSIANTLNQRADDLNSAKKNIQALRKTARQLKSAIKNGDTEKAESLRENFAQLQTKRDEISSRVSENNLRSALDGPQAVRVGNETRASFRFSAIEVEGSSEVDTSSVKGLKAFLKDSKEDLGSIRSQIQEERGDRKELRQLNRDIRSERNNIISNSDEQTSSSINSLEEAGLAVSSLVQQITNSALEQSVNSKLDETIASKLLG
jgi:predicted  nucleic acid-binding Zn-ribbon protein